MNELERSAEGLQRQVILDLRERGEISPFDFAEPIPLVPGAMRFGDIVVEANGDSYYG